MNQNQQVLDYIDRHGSITSLEAFKKLGVTRLSARIKDIKDAGIQIDGLWDYTVNRYGDQCRVKRYFRGTKNGETESVQHIS